MKGVYMQLVTNLPYPAGAIIIMTEKAINTFLLVDY